MTLWWLWRKKKKLSCFATHLPSSGNCPCAESDGADWAAVLIGPTEGKVRHCRVRTVYSLYSRRNAPAYMWLELCACLVSPICVRGSSQWWRLQPIPTIFTTHNLTQNLDKLLSTCITLHPFFCALGTCEHLRSWEGTLLKAILSFCPSLDKKKGP